MPSTSRMSISISVGVFAVTAPGGLKCGAGGAGVFVLVCRVRVALPLVARRCRVVTYGEICMSAAFAIAVKNDIALTAVSPRAPVASNFSFKSLCVMFVRVAALVEGNSLRSTCRMTGVCMPAVLKLLADLGPVCAEYHDRMVRHVNAQRVQVDEIWQFVGAKAKNVKDEKKAHGWGDTWTWVGMCADTKLIVSWFIGQRDWDAAYSLMLDLSARLANRIQLTTDGNRLYVDAVQGAFGRQIDYAMLKEVYGFDQEAKRYSPAKIVSTEAEVIKGNPDPRHISTSFIERQNLTMRMSMRRFTRLTNGLSKKIENHSYAVALHFMHYNFARIHKTLRVTPAMAAGLCDHVWGIEEIVGLLETQETKRVA